MKISLRRFAAAMAGTVLALVPLGSVGAAPHSGVEAAAAAADIPWTGTWATAMQGTGNGTTFNDQTIRQVVRTSIGGSALRIRLSNLYGSQPLTLADVYVAESLHSSTVVPGTNVRLTFGGESSVTIAAGGDVLSDALSFPVAAEADLVVSLYVPGSALTTQHGSAKQVNWLAAGNQSAAETLTGGQPIYSYNFLAGLEVQNRRATGSVVTFGASITEGFGTTDNANRRWPNLLGTRLNEAGYQVGVLNQGISGNNLLRDGGGQAGVVRFQRDALDQPGVRWVIFADDPINDIINYNPPASDLINGLSQLIAAAHARNVDFICSTLTPVKGFSRWDAEREVTRQAVNAFMRSSSSGCDGIVDQATATGDPVDPEAFLPAYDLGDHLHPNEAGLKAIADAVPLALFGAPAGPAIIRNPMVDNPGLSYGPGWSNASNRNLGDWKNGVHLTTTAGATARFTFEGNGIEVWSERYGDMGAMDIYIDDALRDTVDLRVDGPRQVQQVVFAATGLASGTHTLTVVSRTSGPIVMIDAVRILSDRTVNDTAAGYDENWRHPTNRGLGDFDDDVHYTLVPGAVAEFSFYGNEIHLLSERNGDEGTMDIIIDSGPPTSVNLQISGPRQVQQVVFSATGLSPTRHHTLTIVNTAAIPRIGMIDAFRVVSS